MKIKEEKGAISVLVIVTMLFIVAILTSMYMSAANRYSTQMEVSKQIKEVYEKDLGQIADVYETYQAEGLYIYTKADLEKFRDRVNSGINFEGKTVYLMNDIDLNEGNYIINEDGTVTFLDGAEQWTPIGNVTFSFYGIFDGNGHKIKGLYINKWEQYKGIFGINNGTIQDITLSASYIYGSDYIGGIVGKNNGIVRNCTNEAKIIGNSVVGGVVGDCGIETSVIIKSCNNKGTIKSSYITGGVVARLQQGNIIENSSNDGKIDGNGSVVGGILGINEGGDIIECINNAKVIVTREDSYGVGGIVGRNSKGNIKNCTNNGEIQGIQQVAGIAGNCGGVGNSIENCHNRGNIRATSGNCNGGIIGYGGAQDFLVSNCTNNALITSVVGSNTGGIVGWYIRRNSYILL